MGYYDQAFKQYNDYIMSFNNRVKTKSSLINNLDILFKYPDCTRKVLIDFYLKMKTEFLNNIKEYVIAAIERKDLLIIKAMGDLSLYKEDSNSMPNDYDFSNEDEDLIVFSTEKEFLNQLIKEIQNYDTQDNHLMMFEKLMSDIQENIEFDFNEDTDQNDINNNNNNYNCNNYLEFYNSSRNDIYTVSDYLNYSKIKCNNFINDKVSLELIGINNDIPTIPNSEMTYIILGINAKKYFTHGFNSFLYESNILNSKINKITNVFDDSINLENEVSINNKNKNIHDNDFYDSNNLIEKKSNKLAYVFRNINKFIKDFSPKFMKKESIDKMIIRRFRKYLKAKYKKELDSYDKFSSCFINNIKNGKNNNQIRDGSCLMNNQINSNYQLITKEIEFIYYTNKHYFCYLRKCDCLGSNNINNINANNYDKTPIRIESNKTNTSNITKIINTTNTSFDAVNSLDASMNARIKKFSINFLFDFITKNFIPPFKSDYISFKSFNINYLTWLFKDDLIKILFSEFYEENGFELAQKIILDNDLLTKEPSICDDLRYYVKHIHEIYNSNELIDDNLYCNSSNIGMVCSRSTIENKALNSIFNIFKYNYSIDYLILLNNAILNRKYPSDNHNQRRLLSNKHINANEHFVNLTLDKNFDNDFSSQVVEYDYFINDNNNNNKNNILNNNINEYSIDNSNQDIKNYACKDIDINNIKDNQIFQNNFNKHSLYDSISENYSIYADFNNNILDLNYKEDNISLNNDLRNGYIYNFNDQDKFVCDGSLLNCSFLTKIKDEEDKRFNNFLTQL